MRAESPVMVYVKVGCSVYLCTRPLLVSSLYVESAGGWWLVACCRPWWLVKPEQASSSTGQAPPPASTQCRMLPQSGISKLHSLSLYFAHRRLIWRGRLRGGDSDQCSCITVPRSVIINISGCQGETAKSLMNALDLESRINFNDEWRLLCYLLQAWFPLHLKENLWWYKGIKCLFFRDFRKETSKSINLLNKVTKVLSELSTELEFNKLWIFDEASIPAVSAR